MALNETNSPAPKNSWRPSNSSGTPPPLTIAGDGVLFTGKQPSRQAEPVVLPTRPADKFFAGIQALRGISVAFVVLAHLPASTGPFAKLGVRAPWFIGVAIFYGISGWIIAHVTRSRESSNVAAFLTKRLFRLVPVLLVTLGTSIAFSIMLPHDQVLVEQFYPDIWPTLRVSFANLLFVSDLSSLFQLQTQLGLMGLWSISVEAKFYLVYATLLILSPKARSGVVLSLFMIIFAIRCHLVTTSGSPDSYSHVFFVELFCLGTISYQYKDLFRPRRWALFTAWTWVMAFALFEPRGYAFLAGYAGLLASIIYIVNYAAMQVQGAGGVSSFLTWLGERSYVLYVLHFQLLAITGLIAQLNGLNLSSPLLYDLSLVAAVVLGMPLIELVHQTIEKGGIRLGARVANRL